MAYIRYIPPSRAAGRLAQVYREVREEVPRVPNFLQLLSLRPEILASIYHSWLAIMWNGRVPRTTKEAIAVAVARAARCEYCADAHLVYLMAAGVEATRAYELESELDAASWLTSAESVAVRLAVRATTEPRSVGAAEIAAFADAWPQPEERVEIISVIAAFNTVARLANALGVRLEIPAAVRRFETGRRGALALLARLTALSLDLGEKPVRARTPEENHAAMQKLFTSQLGFSEPPPGFAMLEACPEIFDGQLRTIEKSVCVVPRARWMRLGLIVGRLTGCVYLAENCAQWLERRGEEVSEIIAASEGAGSTLPEAEETCLRFARDLTLHAHTIGEDRVRELRQVGLSDGAILDLAYVASIFNGMVRIVRVLTPLEEREAA